VKSNFGWVRPVPTKYDEKTWKAFVRNYRNAEEYTYDSEHFALAIIPETHQSFAISESTSVVQAWIEDKLPSSLSSYSYSGGQFPVHSLSTTPRTFPTDSDYIDYIAMSST
jgi:hypothetical protein